ncbi:hypothetical protein LOAG_12646 [Loa loa]|uniref:Uncharacterized protein n=1 Tax=Loa loa TaxID=7209 RepID=A0A1S0TKT7_LOALO|nr:hypothetical protein LOAG_12646 [Loa loa]EFO15865.2 hypothetical protein LOAG_12646 [Loa loa]
MGAMIIPPRAKVKENGSITKNKILPIEDSIVYQQFFHHFTKHNIEFIKKKNSAL